MLLAACGHNCSVDMTPSRPAAHVATAGHSRRHRDATDACGRLSCFVIVNVLCSYIGHPLNSAAIHFSFGSLRLWNEYTTKKNL